MTNASEFLRMPPASAGIWRTLRLLELRKACHEAGQVARRVGAALGWSPGGELLVVRDVVGPRLHFEANGSVGKRCQGVPDAWRQIDAKNLAAEDVLFHHGASIVEKKDGDFTLQNDETFCFGRQLMSVRRGIGPSDPGVQKAMRIIGSADVKVVVGAKTGRLSSALDRLGKQGVVDQLHQTHDAIVPQENESTNPGNVRAMRVAAIVVLSALGCQSPAKECPPVPVAPPPQTSAGSTPVPASAAAQAPVTAPAAASAELPAPAPSAPSPLRQGDQVQTPADLEEVNRWATAAGVRDDLLLWIAQALSSQNTRTDVTIEYVGVEAPVTAVVTATLDGYLDDSVRGERFVLKFSRKPCTDCSSGMSGWWLWNMEVTRRCYRGRGHETFSKDRCK